MEIPCFLAMTAAEFASCQAFPDKTGWMACHFSPYGTGISNCPASLPPNSMLILNDRIPICGHDPDRIAEELSQLVDVMKCDSVLLDLQRPDHEQTPDVVRAVRSALSCPVGVSELYAADADCPVFVSSPPPDRELSEHLACWKGREIWLEAATETIQLTVNASGCTTLPLPCEPQDPYFWDDALCSHYQMQLLDDSAVFTIWRTEEDLSALLQCAADLGVTKSIGLYQQLKHRI